MGNQALLMFPIGEIVGTVALGTLTPSAPSLEGEAQVTLWIGHVARGSAGVPQDTGSYYCRGSRQ